MRGEREIRPNAANGLLYILFWWACSLFSSELAIGLVAQLQSQSHIYDSSHILVISVTNDITNMRLRLQNSDPSHRCASAVTTCNSGHMLTLCAWDCVWSITSDVKAYQYPTEWHIYLQWWDLSRDSVRICCTCMLRAFNANNVRLYLSLHCGDILEEPTLLTIDEQLSIHWHGRDCDTL